MKGDGGRSRNRDRVTEFGVKINVMFSENYEETTMTSVQQRSSVVVNTVCRALGLIASLSADACQSASLSTVHISLEEA